MSRLWLEDKEPISGDALDVFSGRFARVADKRRRSFGALQ